MRPFELPRNLAGSREVQAWAAELPGVLDEARACWSLVDVGDPFQPGGVVSYVVPATTSAGERVVLKLGWRHDEALHEAEGLRAWGGAGAVRLLAAAELGETSLLLLEACDPGTPLAGSLPADAQDEVIADVLRRLWIDPPQAHPFRPLADMCARWAAGFERAPASALDPGLAREGVELMRSLPGTAEVHCLLCTDLHAGNVLAAQREPWLAIDPKPYVGDPAFDVQQHLLNDPARLAEDAAGFAGRMAGLLELDAERVRRWLFARCVVESPGWPELAPVAATLARSVL